MKSIEANMNALTNEVDKLMIQVKIQKPNRKRYERKATGNQFVVLDVTRKVKLRITVQKQPSESKHNNSKKESSRPVRSNVQPFCRPNGSIGMGSSLEESNLYIKININGMHAKLLVDTGATLTFMSKTLFETIPQGTRPRLQNSKQNCLAANGIMAEPYASGPPKVSCFFSPLGLFFYQKRQLLFDYILNVGEEIKIIYPGTVIGQLSKVKVVESSEEDMTEQNKKLRPDLMEMLKKMANHLTRKQKREAHTLLYEYTNLFAKSDSDLGSTDIVRHKIDTGTNRPVKIPPSRVPTHLTKEIYKHLDDMLERGVIEPSNSPWPAPVVLVKKKDSSFRFCIDYRKLNSNTIKDAYPLPRIAESLDKLSGSSWFSALDLCSGYWQVKMDQEDKPTTAFATRRGLFQFNVMPLGLCCAPATFERLMESVLKAFTGTYVSSI